MLPMDLYLNCQGKEIDEMVTTKILVLIYQKVQPFQDYPHQKSVLYF